MIIAGITTGAVLYFIGYKLGKKAGYEQGMCQACFYLLNKTLDDVQKSAKDISLNLDKLEEELKCPW